MAYTTAGPGATINGLHTLRDLGLAVGNSERVGASQPKTRLVEVPGSSERIDLTEAAAGRVCYGPRTVTLELAALKAPTDWAHLMGRVTSLFHGRRVEVVLDEEPDVMLVGRATVGPLSRTGRFGTFAVEVDAEAFKYDVAPSDGTWQWDALNLEDGIIREYGNLKVSGALSLYIPGSGIPVVPTLTVSGLATGAEAYVQCGQARFALRNGDNRFADVSVPECGATLSFTGTFTLSVRFRGGRL